MARSRRKQSTAQYLVGLAAFGLPEPLRRIVASRLGAPVTLLLALVTAASGVVSVDWSGGAPKVEIDRQRAQEVTQHVAGRVDSVRALMGQSHDGPMLTALLGELAGLNDGSRAATPPPAGNPPILWFGSESPSLPPARAATHTRRGDAIRIASFNIQVFGTSKMAKPEVMGILVDVARRFDIVAIQEIRSVDDSIVPNFVAMINTNGARYSYLIGPRLGRSNSKEQYAFVFDTNRIEVDGRCVYTVPDPQDLLHREPMVARFRVRGVPPEQAFTFSLVNIHTDPDETDTELDALADVFVGVQRNGSGEDDVILLGDLNVDEYQLGRLGKLPNVVPAITGVMTNTRLNRMYDNIVFNRAATVEYAGRFGVLNLMTEYGLTVEQALTVSDHLPVWAEFSVYEGGTGPLARLPNETPRYGEATYVR
ncbi:MAG: endonuclease/exonuclease/phosphatase family protein [Pirellulaceae bacterium]|nr:endonuclease/exonuclease/phosphatase family protein [Pirellulaceae bacterium]